MINSKYALIVTYSFDEEVPVFLFDTEEEAQNALKEMATKEHLIDKDNGWDTELKFSESGNYAQITNHFMDRTDVTKFYVGDIKDCK